MAASSRLLFQGIALHWRAHLCCADAARASRMLWHRQARQLTPHHHSADGKLIWVRCHGSHYPTACAVSATSPKNLCVRCAEGSDLPLDVRQAQKPPLPVTTLLAPPLSAIACQTAARAVSRRCPMAPLMQATRLLDPGAA